MATGNPSNPPKNGQCHLLRLPQELRDEIYRHTLTHPNGLFFICGSSPPTFSDSPHYNPTFRLNPLRCLNRQIYQETKGLLLKIDRKITFPKPTPPFSPEIPGSITASENCANFLESCSPKTRDKIRTITVFEYVQQCTDKTLPIGKGMLQVDAVMKLHAFCKAHPSMNIIMHLDLSPPKSEEATIRNVIINGSILSMLNESSPPNQIAYMESLFELDIRDLYQCYLMLKNGTLGLRNLRFFPWAENFDESEYKEDRYRNHPDFPSWVDRTLLRSLHDVIPPGELQCSLTRFHSVKSGYPFAYTFHPYISITLLVHYQSSRLREVFRPREKNNCFPYQFLLNSLSHNVQQQTPSTKMTPNRGELLQKYHNAEFCVPRGNRIAQQPGSQLLSLPAELRNMIFQYALTEKDGVHVKEGMSTERRIFGLYARRNTTAGWVYKELNQLRYVCRQTYSETKGLGLRYNNLHFPNNTRPREYYSYRSLHEAGEMVRPWTVCLHFLQNLSPEQMSRIKRISLVEWFGSYDQSESYPTYVFSLRGVRAMSEICRAYPKIEITIYLEHLGTRTGLLLWMFFGGGLELALRKRRPQWDTTLFNIEPVIPQLARIWTETDEYEIPFPDNLKVFPSDKYKEDAWEADQLRNCDKFPEWMAQIKKWYAKAWKRVIELYREERKENRIFEDIPYSLAVACWSISEEGSGLAWWDKYNEWAKHNEWAKKKAKEKNLAEMADREKGLRTERGKTRERAELREVPFAAYFHTSRTKTVRG
ncbi:hypothetical protein K505DRAFT_342288 [Melanomma pulvis-pyrius CBS 109.77]|uniref:F-box domain-containing protein n=1 Tax=Melanomma pulvis-pyrius CBS 109.77 TaxID=1314802 RepID=A0A6A6WVE3_9PLEO|nr:hypothetical protein K505DRAFT_342288 [Melanomma pulvis-pyrius CBS 109.77]